jgi:hypothetical protein
MAQNEREPAYFTPFRIAVVVIIFAGVAASLAGVEWALLAALGVGLVVLLVGKLRGWPF